VKSCDSPNAWWDTSALKEALCYELAEDFVNLYRDYTEKPTSQRRMSANKLMSKNVNRMRLAHSKPTESPEAGSDLLGTRVSRDQLGKLAAELRGETAAFFTQTAIRRAALEAKPSKR